MAKVEPGVAHDVEDPVARDLISFLPLLYMLIAGLTFSIRNGTTVVGVMILAPITAMSLATVVQISDEGLGWLLIFATITLVLAVETAGFARVLSLADPCPEMRVAVRGVALCIVLAPLAMWGWSLLRRGLPVF